MQGSSGMPQLPIRYRFRGKQMTLSSRFLDREVSCMKGVLDTLCFQLTTGSSGESLAEIKEDLHYMVPAADSTDPKSGWQ